MDKKKGKSKLVGFLVALWVFIYCAYSVCLAVAVSLKSVKRLAKSIRDLFSK